jgi:hypothetical protein
MELLSTRNASLQPLLSVMRILFITALSISFCGVMSEQFFCRVDVRMLRQARRNAMKLLIEFQPHYEVKCYIQGRLPRRQRGR